MSILNPEFNTYQRELLLLKEENSIFREEIRTARKASEITADLVVKQFEETEKILYRFQSANALRKAVLDSASHISIIAADRAGVVIVFNKGAENLLGYGADEVIGKKTYDIFHLKEELCLIEEELCGQSGKKIEGIRIFFDLAGQRHLKERECAYVRKDGGKFPVMLSVNRLLGADGAVSGFLCVATDISEIKRSEKALRESEKKYRVLVNNLPNIVYKAYMNGSVEFFDDKIEILTGYGKEEFLSGRLNWYDLIVKEDIDHVKDPFRKALAGDKSYIRQYRIKTKAGNIIWIEDGAQIFCDEKGRVEFITGAFLDITVRKAAEEALRKSEEKYRNILETMEEGYFEVDLKGNLTFTNNGLCKMVGSDQNELLGFNYRSFFTPGTSERFFNLFNEIYLTGEPRAETGCELMRKGGSTGFFDLSVYLMRDHEGKPSGFRGISRDITERMKSEQEKRRLEEQLAQARKLESIGTLAGGVAHDFNNLLMALQGNATLIQLVTDKNHPNYEKLENIMALVKTGADLTRLILEFARGGKYVIETSDLNEVVKNTLDMFARTKKEIKIIEKYSKDLWLVDIDRGQIGRVLVNLYVNASDAMPGGGSMYIGTENIILSENQIKAHEAKQEKYIKITVTDTGIGMDDATMQKIFEPFFSTKERGRGTGLGLASVYGIIKGNDGFIEVASRLGEGTAFAIYFPASRSGSKVLHTRRADSALPLKGVETVLLVDDESVILDAGGEVLRVLGYNVLTAKNGKEAIEILKKAQGAMSGEHMEWPVPDLVILDMIMPEMGGAETFAEIKTINPGIKVLLASGYSIDGEACRILERGCNGFIQKPFTLLEISSKIREILKS
ncbi:MAG: PAS domain S-box protein [Desulfobacterales bacterium]|nr:PAS domain S-box protein [Desulfobacterales bacterium]